MQMSVLDHFLNPVGSKQVAVRYREHWHETLVDSDVNFAVLAYGQKEALTQTNELLPTSETPQRFLARMSCHVTGKLNSFEREADENSCRWFHTHCRQYCRIDGEAGGQGPQISRQTGKQEVNTKALRSSSHRTSFAYPGDVNTTCICVN